MKHKKTLIAVVGVLSFFVINYFFADTAANRKKMAEQVRQEVSDFRQHQTIELETKLRRRLSSGWDFERGYTIVEVRKLESLGGVFKPEVEEAISHQKFYRREAILTLGIIRPYDDVVLNRLARLVEERGDIGSFAISGIAKMAKYKERAKALLQRLSNEHPDKDVAEKAKSALIFLD